MKLVVCSQGDSSVGIRPIEAVIEIRDWNIEDLEKDERDAIRSRVQTAFREIFDDSQTFAMFEDED